MKPLVLWLAILIVGVARAAELSFPEFEEGRAKYLEAVGKIQATREQRLGPLNQGYAVRLEGLRKTLESLGDKDGAAAVRAEQGRVKLGAEPSADHRKTMPGLLRAQRATYEKERQAAGADPALEAQADAAWVAEVRRLYFQNVNPLSTDKFARQKAVRAHAEMNRLAAKAAGGAAAATVPSSTPTAASLLSGVGEGPETSVPAAPTAPIPRATLTPEEIDFLATGEYRNPADYPPTEAACKAAAEVVANLTLNNPFKVPEAAEILKSTLSRGLGQLKKATEVTLLNTYDAVQKPMWHKNGEAVELRGTKAASALVGTSKSAFMYGPYDPVEPGRYLIVFRYKFRGAIKGKNGCLLDVACQANAIAGAQLPATATPAREWVVEGVELKMTKPRILEYRLWPGGNEVAVDRVYLYRLENGK